MNLFTASALEDLPEPHTPRYAYHCREHPDLENMEYEHPHFRSEHQSRDVRSFRVRCTGSLCNICLR